MSLVILSFALLALTAVKAVPVDSAAQLRKTTSLLQRCFTVPTLFHIKNNVIILLTPATEPVDAYCPASNHFAIATLPQHYYFINCDVDINPGKDIAEAYTQTLDECAA
jgi:hypothetical protein